MASGSDAEEFTALVDRRWHALVRAPMLLGCAPVEAEDVAQAALTRFFKHWRRVRGAEDPDAYAHRVLVNTFVDAARRRSRGELSVADPADAAAPAPDHAGRLDIERALGRLSTEQRIVVVLRYYLDLCERQAAEVLRVPPGTVKRRLSRGLAPLAEDVRPDPDPEGGLP